MTFKSEYSRYQEISIDNRFIKHSDLLPILQSLKEKSLFHIEVVGYSFEGRSLNLVKVGSGTRKVFIWSQMHGDEATATMSIVDLLHFIDSDDELNFKRHRILKDCTLYILPMVNPDGSEIFTRRNAQGIDINRDFHRQQTPEGRILRSLHDQIQPHFGFNMHDQSIQWSAGKSGKPATISVLAPAYDAQISWNQSREDAVKVISRINTELQKHIPGYVGRFNDEFEPRAFGDNFQAAGTSTILIEAGGYRNDPEKQFIRQLTLIALITALESIAEGSYFNEVNSVYFDIPENEKRHYHLLLKNCQVRSPLCNYTVDIGLVAEQNLNPDQRSVSYSYKIDEVGDLSGFFGYEEIDASKLQLILTRPLIVDEVADLILLDHLSTVLCIENGCITNKNL